MKSIHAVGGVVYRATTDNMIEILLIRKQGGEWSLPKGKLKRNEEEFVGVLREIYEETGITGEVIDMIAQAVYPIEKPGGPRTKSVVYYLIRAVSGDLTPDARERIIRVRWMSLDQAARRLRRPRLQTILRSAQTLLGPAAVRSDG